ncbi:MAG TPA: glycine/sarcosine/betaine reductase selenoprotein B family protein [Burkholderiales bacterium]|nr:glycine/sarcosine/betaine reductase selenoprotein B family protein [Burkholderiales bacterium]
MVRLADLPEWDRKIKIEKLKELDGFDGRPWVRPPPLAECRIAVVTTAGLHRKGDRPFGQSATDYRIIPGGTRAAELVMSHQSVNFDRSGFHEDHNVVFPIDRLNELAASGAIGSVAAYHYSFMGATQIRQLEPKAVELAALLKADSVDAVLLTPI